MILAALAHCHCRRLFFLPFLIQCSNGLGMVVFRCNVQMVLKWLLYCWCLHCLRVPGSPWSLLVWYSGYAVLSELLGETQLVMKYLREIGGNDLFTWGFVEWYEECVILCVK